MKPAEPEDADRQVIGIYARHADAFVRQRSRVLFERAWLDAFLAVLPARAAVLDLGCGFGEPMASHLVAAGCTVTGVDTSSALLAEARVRLPGQDWRQADMRTLAPGRRYHGLLAWDSFFHLTPDDQRAMLGTFSEHLVEGGALMFTSGPEAGVRIGRFEGEPLYHASLAPDEYRRLLAAQGFDVLRHRAEDPACGGRTVWLARLGGSGS